MFKWFVAFWFLSGCASYQWGYRHHALPGGYQKVAVAMMKNKTSKAGIEVYFTRALKRALNRYPNTVSVVESSQASVRLEGELKSLKVTPTTQAKGGTSELFRMPKNAILNTRYKIEIQLHLKLVKNTDNQVLWSGDFQAEETYSTPRMESPVINSANALYNHSAKEKTIQTLAEVVTEDVQSKLFESF